MPEQSFAQSLQIAGSGFDTKLAGLMGIGQAIAQGQMMKTQMSQQLQQQKELVDYRADAQFQQQKRVAEEITGPQQQAAQQAKNLETFNKSITEARNKTESWSKDFSENYSDLTYYNLLRPVFRVNPTPDPQTGMAVPEVVLLTDGDPVSVPYTEYRLMSDNMKGFATFLSNLESDLREGNLPETLPEEKVDNRERFTQKKAEDMITAIRRNPQDAMVHYEEWRKGSFSQIRFDDDAKPQDTKPTQVRALVSDINTFTDGTGVLNLDTIQTSRGWNLKKTHTPVKTSINFGSGLSVGEYVESLNEASKTLFDVDLSEIPLEARDAILTGEEVPKDYESIAKKINKVKDGGETERTFNQITKLYYDLQAGFNEWKVKLGDLTEAIGDDKNYTINLNARRSEELFVRRDNINSANAQAAQAVHQTAQPR